MGLLEAVEDFGKAVANIGEGIAEVFDDPISRHLIPGLGVASGFEDLAEFGSRAAQWFGDVGADKFLATAHSPILQGGQMVIAGMRRTTGTGEPEDGEGFGRGSDRFTDAADVLATAGPTDDWTGDGSDSYAGQNGRQRGRTSTMAGIDRGMHQVIAREAFQIKFHRGKLDDQSNWLADVGRTTFTLGLIPGIGPAMKAAAETQAVIAAVGSSAAELQSLSGEVSANAAAIQKLTAAYQGVADHTPKADIKGPGHVPPDHGDDPPQDPPPGKGGTPPEQQVPGSSGTPAPSAGGGGTPSGGGGGTSGGGGAPAGASMPSAPTMPSVSTPNMPQTPMSGAAPGASSGMPAGMGGLPSALGGAPSQGAGLGGATAGLAQLIQAAVQRAMDKQERDKALEAENEDDEIEAADREKDSDGDGVPDSEEDENGVDDGDGIPDSEEKPDDAVMVAAAGPGTPEGGRAPVHLELDVDPERLATPMTITVDRDRSIVVPPTATT